MQYKDYAADPNLWRFSPSKQNRQRLLRFFLMMLLCCFTFLSLDAQNTPIAIDNNPTNDCAGNDCWDWFNWTAFQDGMGNTVGGDGIAEDNGCGTIGATATYSGPDATPDFTGILMGANTTDGTTPDIWTITFDQPLTNPVLDVNSLENDTELCFTDCDGNPLTITILGTSLDPGPNGAHCVTSGTNFIQITGTYDCILITGSIPDNDPYTLGFGTCLVPNICDVADPVAVTMSSTFCPGSGVGNAQKRVRVEAPDGATEVVVWTLTDAPAGSQFAGMTPMEFAMGETNSEFRITGGSKGNTVTARGEPKNSGTPVTGTWTFSVKIEDTSDGCESSEVTGYSITAINDTEPPMANCPSPASGPNVLVNGSFEENDGFDQPFLNNDWTNFAVPAFSLDGNIIPTAQDGDWYLKQFGPNSGIFQDHPIAAGDNVTASVYFRNAGFDQIAPGCLGFLKVEFLDAGNSLIAVTEIFVDNTLPVDVWTQFTINATAPSGVVTIRLVLSVDCPTGGAVFFDNASLSIDDGSGPPTDFVLDNDPDACGAIFDFIIPDPDDNCGATATADVMSGSLFPVGPNVVTVTATDGAGNTSTCSFNVIVNDVDLPVANCPVAADGANLLTNASFEDNNGFDQPFGPEWTSFGPVLSIDQNILGTAQDGDWYLKMFGANTGTFQDVEISGGDNLATSVYVQNASFDPMLPGCTAFIKLEYFNAGGGFISAIESPKLDNTLPLDTWTQLTFNDTAPANAATVRFIVFLQCTGGGAAFYDNASLAIDNGNPGDFTINYMPGQCGATVDFTVPDPSDNCPGATATPSIPSGSFFNVGTTPLTVTAMDASGNTSTCMVNVVVEDTEMPMPACLDATVNFTGQPAIGVPIAQLYDAAASTDNCGTVNLVSPITDPIVACEQLGEVIDVPIVVNDGNGNEGTCTATITVTGIPCGWIDNGGIDCAGSMSGFDTGASTFSLTAGQCAPAFPYTSDATSFVFTELCGDGEIIAKVDNIAGGQGFAGVMARDSEAPGSPKVSIGTNTINRVRKEVRAIANYPSFPQAVLAYDQFWVRITRTGPTFRAFASTDGVQWFPYIFQNIQMGDCILVGLYAYNEKATSPITATFSNVFVTGVTDAVAGGSSTTFLNGTSFGENATLSIYPNPAVSQITIDMADFQGLQADIRLFNQMGQLMQQTRIDEVQFAEQLDVSALNPGVYSVVVKVGEELISKRLVIARP